MELKIPGKHNILNTLAAASAAYVLGLPGEAVSRGLETFHGAGRRMEHKGHITGRRSTTTTPTIPVSSMLC